MNRYEQILSGGDLRSIGKANEVVGMVNSQRGFDELFKCLDHAKREVVMRAADAIEKITIGKPAFLQKHKAKLIGLCQTAKNIELKWHLALLVSRVQLSQKEFGAVWNLLTHWATSKTESKIVRVNAIQALSVLVQQKKELSKAFTGTLDGIRKENIASLNARIKKLLLICIMSFFFLPVSGQLTGEKIKRQIVPGMGLHYQKTAFLDVRALWTKLYAEPHTGYSLAGPFIGFESSFHTKYFLGGPKAGFEVNFSYFVGRVSLVNYFDHGKADLKLSPEAGFSYSQFVSITYGYNCSLLKYRSPAIGRNKIGLSVFFNKKLRSRY